MKALSLFAQCAVAVALCLCITTSCGSDDEPAPEQTKPVVKIKSIKENNEAWALEYDAQNRITHIGSTYGSDRSWHITYSTNSVKISQSNTNNGQTLTYEYTYTLVGGRVTTFTGTDKYSSTNGRGWEDRMTGTATYTGDKLTKWTQTTTSITDPNPQPSTTTLTFTWQGNTCSKVVSEGSRNVTLNLTASSVKNRGIDFLGLILSNQGLTNAATEDYKFYLPVMLGLTGTPSEYIPLSMGDKASESGKTVTFDAYTVTYE